MKPEIKRTKQERGKRMREIRFRAWDKNQKLMWKVEKINFQTDDFFTIELLNPVSGFAAYSCKEVELMQFTGLTDKNGKEIFEGDIVRWNSWNTGHDDSWETGQIVWDEKGGWIIKENYIDHLVGIYSRVEVIGNIYENPELLEETK